MKWKQSLDRTKSGLSFSYPDTCRNLANAGALVPSHLAVYANFSEITSEISLKLLHFGMPTKPLGRNGDKCYGLQKPETFKLSFHDSTHDSTKGLPGIDWHIQLGQTNIIRQKEHCALAKYHQFLISAWLLIVWFNASIWILLYRW